MTKKEGLFMAQMVDPDGRQVIGPVVGNPLDRV
jgi:hypothetical protein